MKVILKKIRSLFTDKFYAFLWIVSKNRLQNKCLNNNVRENKVVVSLTTFPGRVDIVYKTICTILNQKDVKPDVVELWLSKEQFPGMESELPQKLLKLKKSGLIIGWCDDLKSFKKLIPSIQKYPQYIIVTADDDVYYSRDWLKKLYDSYLKDKNNIYAHKITKFIFKDDNFKAIGGGKDFYPKPSYLNKLVGVGGVLYPPQSLDEDVMRTDLFKMLAPTNDDIWFWLMAVKKGTKVSPVPNCEAKPIDVFGSEQTEKLTDINDKNLNLFEQQFNAMIDYYGDIKNKLIKELDNDID